MRRPQFSLSSLFARPTVPRGKRGKEYALIALFASVVATFIGFSNWDFSRSLNAYGIDQSLNLRGAYSPVEVSHHLPQSNQIVIVDLGHSVPRHIMAQLIEKLRGAKVVGLDITFPDLGGRLTDGERPFYASDTPVWRKGDGQMAKAILKSNNVVIGTWPDRDPIPTYDSFGGMRKKVIIDRPTQLIYEAARWKAHLNVPVTEPDLFIRRALLWQSPTELGVAVAPHSDLTKASPSFALCIAAAMRGESPEKLSSRMAQVAPQEILIDYLGRYDCFEDNANKIAYTNILRKDFPIQQLNGKIVLIGDTSYGNKDTFATPFGDMSGLYIHANIVSTLLSEQGSPRPVPFALVVAFCFAASFGLLTPLLRKAPLWVCLPLGVVESAVIAWILVGGVWILFHAYLPLAAPLLALFITYNAVILYEYLRARGVLARVVGSQGMTQLLDVLAEPELGGTPEVATAFFCDLRGYTSLAQQLPTESLIPLLNMYTDAVVQEILRYEGRPIDYFGDGVFAIFEGPNHAARGLRAALGAPEAVRVRFLELQTLVTKWPELQSAASTPPQMGIALNTGPMIIGLVGSLKRPKPGAVGDTVNVASRVQGLSSVCGMSVLMTRATLDALGKWDENEAQIRSCGEHELKGRDERVEVFGAEVATKSRV